MHKNALFKVCNTLVAMVTTAACLRSGASFSYKNVAKKVKCLFLYLKLNKTFQIGTSTINSDIIRLHIQFSLGVNVNTPIDYLSRYSFGHFCWRVKEGKRLSEFLQKYTDSGTETTHLAGYNILVFEYVNIFAVLPLLFIGAIREKSSKSDIA